MTKGAGRRSLRRRLASARAVVVFAVALIAGFSASSFADEPKPDPAGTATGDKAAAVDAAGNPL